MGVEERVCSIGLKTFFKHQSHEIFGCFLQSEVPFYFFPGKKKTKPKTNKLGNLPTEILSLLQHGRVCCCCILMDKHPRSHYVLLNGVTGLLLSQCCQGTQQRIDGGTLSLFFFLSHFSSISYKASSCVQASWVCPKIKQHSSDSNWRMASGLGGKKLGTDEVEAVHNEPRILKQI
jgi:hypothetical protein